MIRSLRTAFAALLAGAAIAASPPAKAETVIVGVVGAVSSTHWPVYIGLNKGYFAAEDLKLDLVFIQSSAALVQQLAAGSLDLALSTGLVDPIRAIDKGAPHRDRAHRDAGCRPMRCWPSPPSRAGRTSRARPISIGGAKDITRIYRRADAGAERRQARRVRHGVRRRDLGALLGAAGRRGRCRDPDAAVQFPRPDRRASPISAMTIDYARTCRSPARR